MGDRRTLSRGGFLLTSVAAALVPALAGVTYAAWHMIGAFSRIATTGSGGLRAMVGDFQLASRALTGGIVVFIVLVAVAMLVAVRRPAAAASPATGGLLVSAVAVSVLIILSAVTVHVVERAIYGSFVGLSRVVNLEMPPAVARAAQAPTAAYVRELDRLPAARAAGVALTAGALVLAWLLPRGMKRRTAPRDRPAVGFAVALAAVVVAAVNLWQLQPTIAWLRVVVAAAGRG